MSRTELQKYSADLDAVLEKIHNNRKLSTDKNAVASLEIALDNYPQLGYLPLDFLQKYSDLLGWDENE